MVIISYGKQAVTRKQKSEIIRKGMKACEKRVFEKESGYQYSITHTDKYSAAILSEQYRVGIDIEKKTNVLKNAGALDIIFPEDCTLAPTVRWCAHEVIGKIERTGLSIYYPIFRCKQASEGKLSSFYRKGSLERCVEMEILEDMEYVLAWGYMR